MAKLSSVNKNERRKKLVAKYAAKYARLKAAANDESLTETERLIARLRMAEIPRNANPTRVRNRCALTGRPRAYYRKFGLARVIEEMEHLPQRGDGPAERQRAAIEVKHGRECSGRPRVDEVDRRDRRRPPGRRHPLEINHWRRLPSSAVVV